MGEPVFVLTAPVAVLGARCPYMDEAAAFRPLEVDARFPVAGELRVVEGDEVSPLEIGRAHV